ncbi:hypothetical protein BY458DRAFT_497308 [Sporodiniella umbellata]|nr:hypothetical protein BY458DRAFT_497308 [Sporodiniella umbellata]
MSMLRSGRFLWALCLSMFVFILFFVTYSTGSIGIQLRLKIKKAMRPTGEEKYLTYYPHSGLHNQRLAIINAIVLAKVLNRTLLLPEINVGKGTSWAPTSRYERKMSVCPLYHQASDDCSDFRKYVPLSAEAIFDLSAARAQGVRIIPRQDMSQDYFRTTWAASESDIYRIQDTLRLSYRLYDHNNNTADMMNFTERIDLQALAERQEPFMVFGSLHYTHRLALSDPQLLWLIQYLRAEISLAHPVVIKQALRVVSRLGGPERFVAVHLRQGDGFFKKAMADTVQAVHQALSSHSLPITPQEAHTLHVLQTIPPTPARLEYCLRLRSDHPRLRLIYMATDTPQPRTSLQDLHFTFPCLFTLSDFPDILHDILLAPPMITGSDTLDQEYQRIGSQLNGLLIPMVDAEITSHGSIFIGTKKSTFSNYIQYRLARFKSLFLS